MTRFESTVDCLILWGARAGIGPGYTLEAAAVRLAADIAELRDDGGIPAHVRTVITVLPQQRVRRSGSRACRSRPTLIAPPSAR